MFKGCTAPVIAVTGSRPGSASSPAQVLRLQRQVRELQERLNVTQLQQQTTI